MNVISHNIQQKKDSGRMYGSLGFTPEAMRQISPEEFPDVS